MTHSQWILFWVLMVICISGLVASIWSPGKRKQPKIRVIIRASNKLKLHEFRSDPALVGIAQRVCMTEDFSVLLAVLNNEHPAGAVLPFSAQEHERAAHQARCEGYTIALANIEAMTKYAPVPKELEATFEPETEE